jgi:hypothetical protein
VVFRVTGDDLASAADVDVTPDGQADKNKSAGVAKPNAIDRS